eukprot:3729781-Rhodomonas_salina.3
MKLLNTYTSHPVHTSPRDFPSSARHPCNLTWHAHHEIDVDTISMAFAAAHSTLTRPQTRHSPSTD